MENVPELQKQSLFYCFLEILKNLRYHISYNIVNCPNYGIPQMRKRLVLLASRFGSISLIDPDYTLANYRTVRQTIGNLPTLVAGQQSLSDPLHICSNLSKINLQRIINSSQGGTWHDWDESLQLKCHKKSSGRSYGAVYGRMKWDTPSPTITTQFFGYGNGRFGHPEQNRAISLREGALLQSFPIDYEFVEPQKKVNLKLVGTHIGNAVPVLLAKVIGLSIITHLSKGTNNE
jgi:DNA (cytosine-5)-methyltransferase 1